MSMAPIRSSIMAPAPSSCLLLGQLLETTQVSQPHLPQDDLEGSEPSPVGLVVPMGTFAPLRDQTGRLQHAQVLRYRWPAHVVDSRGDLPRGALAVPDQAQNLPSAWIGDRPHGGFEWDRAVASSGLHYWRSLI